MLRFLTKLLIWSLVIPLSGLLVSLTWVWLDRPPVDPWAGQTLPPEGEHIQSDDGVPLFLRRWLPQGDVRVVLLGIHGLGQHSGYHRAAGELFAEAGVAYYGLDTRGNGLTQTPHGDVPSVARLYDDLDLVVAALGQRHPGARIYVLGHSMGAAMGVSWAAERQPAIAGLLALAPAMTADHAAVPWTNFAKGPALWMFARHRAVLRIDESAYARERLQATINAPEQLDFIVSDPLQLQGMSMSFALAAQQFREQAIGLADQVRVPTLVLVGDQDAALPGAQLLYDALRFPSKQLVVMPHVTHMLFQLQETPEVVEAVMTWLRQQGPS